MKFKESWRKFPRWLKANIIASAVIFIIAFVLFLSETSATIFIGAFFLSAIVFAIGTVIGKFSTIKHVAVKGFFIGAFVGLLILWFDYDFLLNPGGPETHIIDTVAELFGISFSNEWRSLPVILLLLIKVAPELIIITFPAIIGLIVGFFIDKVRTQKKNKAVSE